MDDRRSDEVDKDENMNLDFEFQKLESGLRVRGFEFKALGFRIEGFGSPGPICQPSTPLAGFSRHKLIDAQ